MRKLLSIHTAVSRKVVQKKCKSVWDIFNKINSTSREHVSSEDLRGRSIWLKKLLGYSVDEVAVQAGLC